jgi:predicted phage terminase large subunit-like protein
VGLPAKKLKPISKAKKKPKKQVQATKPRKVPKPFDRTRKRRALKALKKARAVSNRHMRRMIMDGRVDVLMKLCGYRFDDFHDVVIEYQRENDTTLQLAPRGWGKSTIGTVGAAACEVIRNRDIRILIASETVTQAKKNLRQIKAILTHKRVRELFGDLRGELWNEDQVTVAGRDSTKKESTIAITGVDGGVTGDHYDIIYADDLVSFKSSRTEGSLEKTKGWFRTTLLPCVDHDTQFRVIGTRYHPADLYGDLIERDPKFKRTTQIVPAITPDGKSNNPEIWSTEKLLEMRESMTPAVFNSQYNQNPSGIEGSIFDDKHFHYVKTLPANLVTFTGVDLAIGKKDHHAKFAVCTIGVDPQTFRIYVISYVATRMSLKQQNETILEHYQNHNPVAVGIESNAFQQSKVEDLRETDRYSAIPAIGIPTDKDKITRAQRLQVRFERGEIFFLESEKGGELEDHLLAIPDGIFFDLFDALDIAVRTAFLRRKKKKNKRKHEPGIIGGSNKKGFFRRAARR